MTDAPAFEPLPESPVLPPVYASFSIRMIASMLDTIIILIVFGAAIEWMVNRFYPQVEQEEVANFITQLQQGHDVVWMLHFWQSWMPSFWDFIFVHHIIQHVILSNFLLVLAFALYHLPFWIRYSSTPGKMLFRLKIYDEKTRLAMSRRQCLMRFFGYILAALPLSLGFALAAITRKRQGVQDFVGRTVVLVKPRRKKRALEFEPTAPSA